MTDDTQEAWPFVPDERIDVASLPPRGLLLLEIATEVFLELGYGSTSVDEIVRRAGSSKATVYRLFASKERLFAAVVDNVVGEIEQPITLDAGGDLELTLQHVAAEHLAVVLSERHVRLMRVVAAEAARFAELGAAYYRHGPALGHQKVAAFLREHAANGTISCDDPVAAAEDFWGIVLHHATLARLYGVMPAPEPGAVDKQARTCVERFLRLYRTEQEGSR